eukprot:jgi/Undpi1/13613/HiC_scaffold_9.g03267.m1
MEASIKEAMETFNEVIEAFMGEKKEASSKASAKASMEVASTKASTEASMDVVEACTEVTSTKASTKDIVWQAVTISRKFDNPSTSFSVSDDEYDFPRLSVCVWDGQGCDENVGESACIATAFATVQDSCYEDIVGVKIQQEDECLAFYLEDVDMVDIAGNRSVCDSPTKPFLSVSMSWYSSSNPSAQASYSAGVPVFLGDRLSTGYSAVPFSRVVYSPDSAATGGVNRVDAAMTIGKTITTSISGDSVSTYPALTLSAVDYDDRDTNDSFNASTNDNEAYAFGFLYLTVTQGSHSLTELKDISPFDAATVIGNIGGFWELLLVAWGLCFISSRPTAPTLKARDLTECICRKEHSNARTVDSRRSRRYVEERAPSDTADRGAHHAASGGGNDGVAFGHHTVADSGSAPMEAENGTLGGENGTLVGKHGRL